MLLSLLAAALLITWLSYFLRSRRLLAQARTLGLQFSRPDRFRLSRRVALQLPVPGAAEVIVRDVAYLKIDTGILCIMTASFTIGAVGRRRMIRRVCAALDTGNGELHHFRMLEGTPTPDLYTQGLSHLRSSLNPAVAA